MPTPDYTPLTADPSSPALLERLTKRVVTGWVTDGCGLTQRTGSAGLHLRRAAHHGSPLPVLHIHLPHNAEPFAVLYSTDFTSGGTYAYDGVPGTCSLACSPQTPPAGSSPRASTSSPYRRLDIDFDPNNSGRATLSSAHPRHLVDTRGWTLTDVAAVTGAAPAVLRWCYSRGTPRTRPQARRLADLVAWDTVAAEAAERDRLAAAFADLGGRAR